MKRRKWPRWESRRRYVYVADRSDKALHPDRAVAERRWRADQQRGWPSVTVGDVRYWVPAMPEGEP